MLSRRQAEELCEMIAKTLDAFVSLVRPKRPGVELEVFDRHTNKLIVTPTPWYEAETVAAVAFLATVDQEVMERFSTQSLVEAGMRAGMVAMSRQPRARTKRLMQLLLVHWGWHAGEGSVTELMGGYLTAAIAARRLVDQVVEDIVQEAFLAGNKHAVDSVEKADFKAWWLSRESKS